jgi:hypothetical protein
VQSTLGIHGSCRQTAPDGNICVMLKEADMLFRRFDQARIGYQQT